LHNTSGDVATVFVALWYLHNTSGDVATVFVALWYLHNTSGDVATVLYEEQGTTYFIMRYPLLNG